MQKRNYVSKYLNICIYNKHWRCSLFSYILYPRSQETWVKNEKDAYHIHKKKLPNKRVPVKTLDLTVEYVFQLEAYI